MKLDKLIWRKRDVWRAREQPRLHFPKAMKVARKVGAFYFLRGKLANLRTRCGDEIMNINAIRDEREKKAVT